MFHVPEKDRLTDRSSPMYSTSADGNNGVFYCEFQSYKFLIIASEGLGWEHVSISLANRIPNWKEMCYFKSLFWDKEDCVVQYHPPESDYVNNDNNCMHLWRPTGIEMPRPPKEFV